MPFLTETFLVRKERVFLTFGARRLLDVHASSSSSQVPLRLPFPFFPELSLQKTYFGNKAALFPTGEDGPADYPSHLS
jgi:hypothetical protein